MRVGLKWVLGACDCTCDGSVDRQVVTYIVLLVVATMVILLCVHELTNVLQVKWVYS